MAKARIEQKVVVHLELTETEAAWLKALLQNPLTDEGEDGYNIRKELFDSLPTPLGTRSSN